ncbi:hypothetical protein AMECASPLE_028100 [Ameca splendens]|uniref:Uncharacterized protein n=1 Tax=Ameca splendens TaxID=208324 RepID=A0ABV0Z3A3_9TELE
MERNHSLGEACCTEDELAFKQAVRSASSRLTRPPGLTRPAVRSPRSSWRPHRADTYQDAARRSVAISVVLRRRNESVNHGNFHQLPAR